MPYPTAPSATVNRLRGVPFVGPMWYDHLTFGNVFYVSSTHANASDDPANNGMDPVTPFATIDYAIGQCTASNGDTIIVFPGHTETIKKAGGITCDVVGARIIGLGRGSDRPTINFTTSTAGTFLVSAANVSVENVIFDITGIDAVVKGISVTAADFTLRRCYVVFADASGQATLALLTSAAANRMTIDNCFFQGSSDAGTAAAIRLTGGDAIKITNNVIVGAFTTSLGGIDVDTTYTTNVDIGPNYIENLTASSTVCINLIASCTGNVHDNRLRVTNDGAVALIDTPGNVSLFENYMVNNNGERGLIYGTASA